MEPPNGNVPMTLPVVYVPLFGRCVIILLPSTVSCEYSFRMSIFVSFIRFDVRSPQPLKSFLLIILSFYHYYYYYLFRVRIAFSEKRNSIREKKTNFQLLQYSLSSGNQFNEILTVGMTSAGFKRFFVRRQNNMNTTNIKINMTNETDATMILNTGLVSNWEREIIP